jgi:hypothetical protein
MKVTISGMGSTASLSAVSHIDNTCYRVNSRNNSDSCNGHISNTPSSVLTPLGTGVLPHSLNTGSSYNKGSVKGSVSIDNMKAFNPVFQSPVSGSDTGLGFGSKRSEAGIHL